MSISRNFELPEIQVSERAFSIFKILLLVTIFLVIVIHIAHYKYAAATLDDYQFVKCPGDTNTYPEGTVCEIEGSNLDEDDEEEDEEEHEEESK